MNADQASFLAANVLGIPEKFADCLKEISSAAKSGGFSVQIGGYGYNTEDHKNGLLLKSWLQKLGYKTEVDDYYLIVSWGFI